MINNGLLQLSPGRVYMGSEALENLGREAGLLGTKALVLTEESLWPIVKEAVGKTLTAAGVGYRVLFHEGHCCPRAYKKAAGQAAEMGAAAVIGIGGGRLLDTAKIASDLAGIRAVTVPTSAATCAAAAWLSVEYTEEGDFVGNYWTRYPPFCSIIDTDLIVRKCPARYNLAGVVDAMAKYPEIEYNLNFTDHFRKNAYSKASFLISEQNYRYFIENGETLITKLREGTLDSQTEEAVVKSITITGLVSCMACGGKQAAISHMIYSYICCYHPGIAGRYLHGEIVGATLCYQLAVNGHEAKDVDALRGFLHSAGMPAKPDEIGLLLSDSETKRMFAFLQSRMPMTEKEAGRAAHYLTGAVS